MVWKNYQAYWKGPFRSVTLFLYKTKTAIIFKLNENYKPRIL